MSNAIDTALKSTGQTRRLLIGAGSLTLLGLLLRLGMWLVYPPASYTDTDRYRYLADALLHDMRLFNGTRAPGYPFFMAVVGDDGQVYLAQMVLGLLITLAFYFIGWQLSHKLWFAVAMGLFHTLNLGQLFFEATLLSETLATYFISFTLLVILLWFRGGKWQILWAVLGGVFAGLTTLTRPHFLFVPLLCGLFMIVTGLLQNHRISWLSLAGVLLPAVLGFVAWSGYIQQRFGVFNITAITGYHLIQNTGNYFEYVPDEHAALRDTYLKYRAQRLAERGTQSNTIWQAIPEMQEVSGLGFYELSQTLTDISLQLIVKYPHLYARSVLYGWWMFWRAPVYWKPETFLVPGLTAFVSGLVDLERIVLFGCNLLFVLGSVALLVWKRLRQILNPTMYMWLCVGLIWIASIVQAMMEQGENPRFLIPLQSVVVLWIAWLGMNFWKIYAKRLNNPLDNGSTNAI